MPLIFGFALALAAAFAQPVPGLKSQLALEPVPLGKVKPRGWLRDWAVSAANGITGHLDERSPVFGESWKGISFPARGAKPRGTGWPLEQGAYWLDGAIRLAYIMDDRALIAKVSKRLDIVVDGVLAGGESFIWWRPKTALDDNFHNWAHSHIGRALVAYYSATKNPRVLQALVKIYSRYLPPDLPDHFGEVAGSVNVDPMLDTYLASGDPAVLAAALEYARSPGYRKTVAAWSAGKLQPGHDVIYYEHIRVPAVLFSFTGDPRDLAATVQAVRWQDDRHLLPIGLSSGEEWHAGIGAVRNVETCNVAASIWTYLTLLRATGDGEWPDRIERVFFNAGPAPVARDFQTMSYYQSPNRYSAAVPGERPRYPGLGESSYQFTPLGHPVLCCVGNLNRVIPNYVMHMWMMTPDGGIAASLYGPSEVRTTVGGNVAVTVTADTAYPFEETVRITVRPDRETEFPLYLRVPAWSGTPQLTINGRRSALPAAVRSFAKLARKWKPGDELEIRFPMSVRVVEGKETPYPAVPYFAKGARGIARQRDIASPYASIYYGALLFALPIRDEYPNQEAPGARFGFALEPRGHITVTRAGMPARWEWALDAAPIHLTASAREFNWQPTDKQPMPPDAITGGRAAKIDLVPYGVTKFRVSMFPIAAAAR
jgi:uncharacterized protein